MVRFMNVFRFLSVWVGIISMLSISPAFASEKPEIFVQLGHTAGIKSVAFSPDGKYALSGSMDHTLKLWEISTGREIRTFKGHTHNIISVAFSPDGRYALSGSEDTTLKLWDIATWREIRTFKGHSKEVNSAVFSADGRYILSSSEDGTVKLWDASTGKEIRTFTDTGIIEEYIRQPDGRLEKIEVIGTRSIEFAIFSPDGKYVLSSGKEGIKLWNIETGKEIRQFAGFGRIAVSPDGKYVLSLNFKTLKLWDFGTGKEIWTSVELPNYIQSIAFSPNSKYALSGDQGGAVKLWDVSTGREIRTFTGHLPLVNSVAFSPDGRYALSGSMNERAIKIWDVESGKEIKTLGEEVYSGSSVTFTKDGRYVLAGNGPNLCLWDVLSGRKIKTFKGHLEVVRSVAFSPNGKYVLSGSFDNTLKLWDISTGSELRTFTGHTKWIFSIAFSPDGKYALSGSSDNTVRLWEVDTGRMVRTILGTGAKGGQFTDVAFLPDGRSFISSYMDIGDAFNPITTFRFFDISTGREIKSFSRGAFGMALSPDGRYIFSNMFELVDINSGKIVRTFSPKGYAAESVFSPDGNYLLTTGERELLLWDVATGGKIREFKGHIAATNSASFSPDAGYVVSEGSDGTIRLWNVSTGKELAQFISFIDGEWIVITPEGYYNSAANGDKHLNVRIGNNVYGIDNYREAFYRPDLVKLALLGGSLKDFKTLADVKQPPVVTIVDTPKISNKDELKVTLKIVDIGGGIGDIRLYLNGSAVVLDSARGVKIVPTNKNEALKTYNLKLTNGLNTIRAIAFNAENTMQSNDVLHEITASFKSLTKPSLNAIIVGINEYKNPKLQLKYAVSDAELFEDTLKKVTAGLFEKVNIKKLVTKENTTSENIIKELKSYKALNPDDVFVFFVASHGTVDEGEYFLITSNVGSTRTEKLKTDALPQGMLKELIANIPATKKLIVLDTCNAGAMGDAIQVAMLTRGMSEDTAIKILSRAVGSTILSASTSFQEAVEGYKGHGLFTYVITEGLNGKADKGKTGYIKTTDLADYVDNEVPILAEKVFKRAQYPTISISGQAFPIGQVK